MSHGPTAPKRPADLGLDPFQHPLLRPAQGIRAVGAEDQSLQALSETQRGRHLASLQHGRPPPRSLEPLLQRGAKKNEIPRGGSCEAEGLRMAQGMQELNHGWAM